MKVTRRTVLAGVMTGGVALATPRLSAEDNSATPPLLSADHQSLHADVFRRLLLALQGHPTFSVVDLADLSDAQWNCGYRWGPDLPFDQTRFTADTTRWTSGRQLALGADGRTAVEAFGPASRMAEGPVLNGVECERYRDESTGLILRAMVSYEIASDTHIARYDVWCG